MYISEILLIKKALNSNTDRAYILKKNKMRQSPNGVVVVVLVFLAIFISDTKLYK